VNEPQANEIITQLRRLRESRGFGAADLANRIGVSRQTIYAIEDGSFVPNTAVALRLAKILDVPVESIFSIREPERADSQVEAEILSRDSRDSNENALVHLCRVNERVIAVPVTPIPAYIPAADGIVVSKAGGRVSVNAAVGIPDHGKRLVIAGCDPALSLIGHFLRTSDIDVIGVPCSSRKALKWLKEGRVHSAGSHLLDHPTGEYNLPFIKRLFPEEAVRVVTFAAWEQGMVLPPGNPKGIRSIADLARKDVTIINREKGSGSRDLLDAGLRKTGIASAQIRGHERIANGHLAAAYIVASGSADCCIANRAAARRFGLDFVPLAEERFDLSFSHAALQLPATSTLLDLLNRNALKKQLQALAGYNTSGTGKVIA
jgi:molybdate-binding protein/DNA-binding XRE family transcriptional regulator